MIDLGTWKKMGKDYNRDVIACPDCEGIFVNRYKKRCPHCKIRLVYPKEGFSIPYDEDGYIWLGEWKKFSEVENEIKSCT